MRQTAQRHIRFLGQHIQIQRFDHHIQSSAKLAEHVGRMPALLRQGGQIGHLRLGMANDDFNRFHACITTGSNNCDSYHILPFTNAGFKPGII